MNAQINPQMHTSPVMNYGQHNAYVSSTPQTPNFFPMSQAAPAWAACMIKDVRAIKEALPKIEKIEKVVNSISLKLTEFEAKLASVETRVDTIETSCSFINDAYEKQKSELKITIFSQQFRKVMC
jgi:septal ring factor EnvC (AmiA/AmiB activator)